MGDQRPLVQQAVLSGPEFERGWEANRCGRKCDADAEETMPNTRRFLRPIDEPATYLFTLSSAGFRRNTKMGRPGKNSRLGPLQKHRHFVPNFTISVTSY